jgi:ribosomal protein S27E
MLSTYGDFTPFGSVEMAYLRTVQCRRMMAAGVQTMRPLLHPGRNRLENIRGLPCGPPCVPMRQPDGARSELVYLLCTCPACGERDVVVKIKVSETPVLTCLSCGRTSADTGSPLGKRG